MDPIAKMHVNAYKGVFFGRLREDSIAYFERRLSEELPDLEVVIDGSNIMAMLDGQMVIEGKLLGSSMSLASQPKYGTSAYIDYYGGSEDLAKKIYGLVREAVIGPRIGPKGLIVLWDFDIGLFRQKYTESKIEFIENKTEEKE